MANEILKLPKGTVVPNHVAIILDGNRRWARARGLNTWEGHKAGYEAVKKLARTSRQLGVHTFTIWAFSTENWERPKGEIDELFKLLKRGLTEFEKECHEHKVKLVHLGRKDRFSKNLADEITKVEEKTKHYKKHILNLALDYGGRDEILRACRKAITESVKPDELDERKFEKYLDTHNQPYPNPDLFIRTSGEQRTSGLFPWQMVYTEYYFEPTHLPDFSPEKLKEAILDYSRRRRRFGGNDAVEHLNFDPEVTAKLEIAWWRLGNIPSGMRLREYAVLHLKEQYGLSKKLAVQGAKYMLEALVYENTSKWKKAKTELKKFYKLIKDELKLAFEPEIVASLEIKARRGNGEGEAATREYLAEVYRLSLFQAAKAAHLRVLANIEKNKGNWDKAGDYLTKYYQALKERVA
ncbi:MAG: polyprenyl diphosphate synthase [bacterium]|nr:polyprenyl diphosphate synthase [bacterium]